MPLEPSVLPAEGSAPSSAAGPTSSSLRSARLSEPPAPSSQAPPAFVRSSPTKRAPSSIPLLLRHPSRPPPAALFVSSPLPKATSFASPSPIAPLGSARVSRSHSTPLQFPPPLFPSSSAITPPRSRPLQPYGLPATFCRPSGLRLFLPVRRDSASPSPPITPTSISMASWLPSQPCCPKPPTHAPRPHQAETSPFLFSGREPASLFSEPIPVSARPPSHVASSISCNSGAAGLSLSSPLKRAPIPLQLTQSPFAPPLNAPTCRLRSSVPFEPKCRWPQPQPSPRNPRPPRPASVNLRPLPHLTATFSS